MTDTSWLVFPARTPSPAPAARLFCLPHAGAGASVFRGWPGGLPAGVEVGAVQLPGREARLAEPLMTNMGELIGALGKALKPYLDCPFALYGHSMGARVAFELARSLRSHGPMPAALFVSGCPAPQIPLRQSYHQLSAEQLLAAFRELGGTPPEAFQYPELLEMMLPILKADFSLAETCPYAAEPPLDCPIVAYCGDQDTEAPVGDVDAWRAQTSSSFSRHVLPGGHFFVQERQGELLWLLAAELAKLVPGVG
jgi:medium-chain acyl-[acyl-carrier-protein] hydrolase